MAAAPARAVLFVGADDSTQRGRIGLVSVGSSDFDTVTFGEGARTLGTAAFRFDRDDPRLGPLDYARLDRTLRWRCDDTVRRFWAFATHPDYRYERASFTLETPSCRNRLTLTRRARMVTIRDTWGLGGIHARLCRPRCRPVTLNVVTRVRGPLLVHAFGRTLRPSSGGPRVLITGDSLMQAVDSVLDNRIGGAARLAHQVSIGAGLTNNGILDWLGHARDQVARLAPNATVVFLGTNDGYPLHGIDCCGPAWVDAYAARARRVMDVYAQHGGGAVLWLTVPYDRDRRFHAYQRAVNTALERAAGPGELLRVDRLLTPGERFIARYRDSDGRHLSPAGARLVSQQVIAWLRKRCLAGCGSGRQGRRPA